MPWIRRAFAAALSMSCFAASLDWASAEPVEPFYKGKTVSLLIGFSPGGSDDLWARLIAQHIGSYIPGHPTVVASNLPGAGSLLLANQIYNTLPQDGTVIGLINRGLPFETLFNGPGILFDPHKMQWIGSPDLDTGICAARGDAAVQTLADLQTKELVVGATGSGADTAIYPQVLSGILGLKFKIVNGYPGSHDVDLAMERNEVQGECIVYDTISRSADFKQGKVRVLLQLGLRPDPRMPDVSLATILAKNDSDKQALDLFILRAAVGRPFVAGPGVPEDKIVALRDAFAASLKDPSLIEEAERAGLHPHYLSAQQIAGVIADAYATPAAAVERLKRAYGR